MGRTEPSLGRPPPAVRRDARAKKAKATINKVIPSLLSSHPRARRGIDATELIVDPPVPKASSAASGHGKGATPSSSSTPDRAEPLRVRLCIADTLTVARSLLEPGQDTRISKPDLANAISRVGILNMASPLSPGGGFLNGATSQEESLCMRTTLLPALKDEYYRLPELGAVYTPDVLVFRDEDGTDLDKRDRWFVDCVSAAMLRIPEVEEVEVDSDAQGPGEPRDQSGSRGRQAAYGGKELNDDDDDDDDDDDNEAEEEDGGSSFVKKRYVNAKDRDLVLHKMRAVMRIFQTKGVRRVVLGAWGCGAYANPVEEIATAWRKVLLGGNTINSHAKNKGKRSGKRKETWDGIDEVIFAIKGGGVTDRFENAFGLDLMERLQIESLDDRRKGRGQDASDDPEELRMTELRERIEVLETQIQQARTQQFKNGLESVLAGLRSQLPDEVSASSAEVAVRDDLVDSPGHSNNVVGG